MAVILAALLVAQLAQDPSIQVNISSKESLVQAWELLQETVSRLPQVGLGLITFLADQASLILPKAPGYAEKIFDGHDSPETSTPPQGESTGFAWDRDPLSIIVTWEDGVDPRNVAIVKGAIAKWQTSLELGPASP